MRVDGRGAKSKYGYIAIKFWMTAICGSFTIPIWGKAGDKAVGP